MAIPTFPHNDRKVKIISLLGYTGAGKTTLLTAGYLQNIIHGEDALTRQFFKRIEQDIINYGEMPLTLRGDACTLTFLDPHSRQEFTVQDFSGEHIKLERKNEEHYQQLLARADQSDALLILISAASFYSRGWLQEEVDAIQTFVNQLKGLGTRIPIAVILTKADLVPRLYFNWPLLRTLSLWLAKLPGMKVHPQRGLWLTQRRFAPLFEGLRFHGKGPPTVFLATAFPHLRYLRPWRWPRLLRWIPKIFRFLLIEPQWLFKGHYNLAEPFRYCFQAFQVGILRQLIIQAHKEPAKVEALMQAFQKAMLEEKQLGETFYFTSYLTRVVQDAHAVIQEIELEIKDLAHNAHQMTQHGFQIPAHLADWLEQAHRKRRRFSKPGGEGAIHRIAELENELLNQLVAHLQQLFDSALQNTPANDPQHAFTHGLQVLRLHQELTSMAVWEEKGIDLPAVSALEQQLLQHLVHLATSRQELNATFYEQHRQQYLSLIKTPPEAISLLDALWEQARQVQQALQTIQAQMSFWQDQILAPLRRFDQLWHTLAARWPLSEEGLRLAVEQALLATLQREGLVLPTLPQNLELGAQLQGLLQTAQAREKLSNWLQDIEEQSLAEAHKTKRELEQRARDVMTTGSNLPGRLRDWWQLFEERHKRIATLVGEKGQRLLAPLPAQVLQMASDTLDKMLRAEGQEPSRLCAHLREGLELHQQLAKWEVFAHHGITLPDTSHARQALQANFVLAVLQKRPLTMAIFREQKQRYREVLDERDLTLQSLEQVVKIWDNLHQVTGPTVRLKNWEQQVLMPMSLLAQAWSELAASFDLQPVWALRQEVEQKVVQSLQHQEHRYAFQRLQEWARQLRHWLQVAEHQQALEQLVNSTAEQIRQQWQADLAELRVQAEQLDSTVQQLANNERPRRPQAAAPPPWESPWQKFEGSLQAIEKRATRLPAPETLLARPDLEEYQTHLPVTLDQIMPKWLDMLTRQRALTPENCARLLEDCAKIQRILRRPDLLSSLTARLQANLQRYRRRRRRQWQLLGLGSVLLLAVAFWAWEYARMAAQIRELQNRVKLYANDYHQQWQTWQRFLAHYPAWLFPTTIRQQACQARDQAQQCQQVQELQTTITQALQKQQPASQAWQRLQCIARAAVSPQVAWLARSALLHCEAQALLVTIEHWPGKPALARWQKEWQRLRRLQEEMRRQEPFFSVPLLRRLEEQIARRSPQAQSAAGSGH